MPELILTEEQAAFVSQTFVPIQVRNTKGMIIGRLEPVLTPATIAELKRRAASPGPWFSGDQVEARLQALQVEWDRTGGFDEACMHGFLARLDESDPGHMRKKDEVVT